MSSKSKPKPVCFSHCSRFVRDVQGAYLHLKENVEDCGKDSESSLTLENVEKQSQSEKPDYLRDNQDNMTVDVKLYQAQVKIVFGLQVLSSLTVLHPPITNVSFIHVPF